MHPRQNVKLNLLEDSLKITESNQVINEIKRRYRVEKPHNFDPFGQTEFVHLGYNIMDPLKFR